MTEQTVKVDKEQATPEQPKTLNSGQVADFLREHPEFFVGRDDLLLDLTLPHQRGDAISLVERQVALLRERALAYRHQLARLADNAKANEKLFERLRLLVLSLLESRDLEQLVEVIGDSLNHEFSIEFHSLILFSENPMNLPVRVEHSDAVAEALGSIMTSGKAICGQVTQAELKFLFQEQADNIGSVAIAPLGYALSEPQQLGVLALGSQDKQHFKASMGTVFISYLGDILSRMLARQLHS
ncbi:DUF484 family protein [Endozoicomonas sp. ONNA2]|uniref:DUF484 family protein n=1 Tax=Endozoicomonas sp. ONNA2 TaxID=2828741 RepID=UPI002148BFA8|nr:DUF484 family protein [Endozoicomonas sp. ONNA2]